MSNWKTELELAIRAAKEAGQFLREGYSGQQGIVSDAGRDIKILADQESETVILRHLSATGFRILAEEGGLSGPGNDDHPMWVIDPLDGTLNYVRGVPLSCVSIALCQGDDPILGVVYDFHRDECFTGIVGEGAWCNEEAIRVSSIKRPHQAVLTTGFPVSSDFDSGPLNVFVGRIQAFKKVRLLGSAALSCAYVACGKVDAYAEDNIMLWDVAAGLALVQAAGGFTDVRPSDRHVWARRACCSSHQGLSAGVVIPPAE